MRTSPIPRVAAIHDLSGFGRSSLTVVIPVLSTMGVQVCPLPTAVLSSQTTGMKEFSFFDLTAQMRDILDQWSKMGIAFDAVYSGFLGSPEQAELVLRCARERLAAGGMMVVDPVLGDDGLLDPTQSDEMVESMRRLARSADIITPNLTEAAFLLGDSYDPELDEAGLKDALRRLSDMGPEVVVITSAPCGVLAGEARAVRVVAYEKDARRFWQARHPYIPAYYPGTGDTFASVLTGALLRGDSVPMGMARAAGFVRSAILATYGYGTSFQEGVMLERVLGELQTPGRNVYEEF